MLEHKRQHKPQHRCSLESGGWQNFATTGREWTGSSKREKQKLQRVKRLLHLAGQLPLGNQKKLVYAKSKRMAALMAASWSRIYSIEELTPINTSSSWTAAAAPCGSFCWDPPRTPLTRSGLLRCYILSHLDESLRTCWSDRQNQGPISMLRQWMAQAGKQCSYKIACLRLAGCLQQGQESSQTVELAGPRPPTHPSYYGQQA